MLIDDKLTSYFYKNSKWNFGTYMNLWPSETIWFPDDLIFTLTHRMRENGILRVKTNFGGNGNSNFLVFEWNELGGNGDFYFDGNGHHSSALEGGD